MTLMMPGRHNVLNATAACAMVLKSGSDKKKLKLALPGFKGVSRRFEIRYQDEENVLIDDYAHHPEELTAAITAAIETYGGPVMGVFQPHLVFEDERFGKRICRGIGFIGCTCDH